MRVLATIALLACVVALPAVALDVPPLAARVNDLAGLLSHEEESALEAQLAAFESATSHQIVVLTIPSLEGETVESFSLRVAERWAIGHAGLDNGVVVVVAAKDRRARIEVGYGLEGVIPDAVAARILRERMLPRFREGAMGAGIADGAAALMAVARGEEIPAARRPGARRDGGPDPLAIVLICGVVGGIVGAMVAGSRHWLGSGLGAALAGGGAALLLSSLLWGGAAALIGALFGAGVGSGPSLSRGGYRGGRAGSSGGGFGGGGFGGGFGGGGGGFGGGGASGGW